MNANRWTRKELLALPVREWNAESEYDSLTIVPTYKVHDSGYRLMAIVGHIDGKGPKEIAAFCDDINWSVPAPISTWIKTDMTTASNCAHMWGNGLRFRVGHSLSSTGIEVVKISKSISGNHAER